MREDNVGESAKLSLETGQDDESAPGGGAEKSPLQELEDEIQDEFVKDNTKGLEILDQELRERLFQWIRMGGKWKLTPDEVAEAYQETMKGICKTIVYRPGTIKNIVGYTFRAAWKRGADALRRKVRRERRKRAHYLHVREAANRMLPHFRRDENDRLDTLELKLEIRNHLNELQGAEGEVAECRFVDGLSIEETAARLELSVPAVKRVSMNIYHKLRTQLLEIRT